MDYKIVVVGAGGVGKSAITVRFIQGNFVKKYDPTIEDSYRKQVDLEGKSCMLDIMDTAGQEEYSALRDQYLQKGEGYLLVYSIISKNTFEALSTIRLDIQRIKETANMPMVIVGNKIDLANERVVPKEKGEELAKEFDCPFIETSAFSGEGISECFALIVREINKKRERDGTGQFSKEKKERCLIQ
jgi:small GTP-binding protein